MSKKYYDEIDWKVVLAMGIGVIALISFIAKLISKFIKNILIPYKWVFIWTIIGIAFILIGILIFKFIKKHIDKKTKEYVLNNSKTINKLNKLNEETILKNIDNNLFYEQIYNIKRDYYNVSEKGYLECKIRENIEYFQQLYDDYKYNEQIINKYDNDIDILKNNLYFTEEKCKELNLKYKKYHMYEEKLLNERIENYNNYILIHVCIKYVSKGDRVHLSKNDTFTFKQFEDILNNVKEEKVSYDIYKRIEAVERAKVTDELRFKVLKRDNYRCRICGASSKDGVHLHVDHIIPLAKGGKTTLDNLQTLCERCNMGKSDSLM